MKILSLAATCAVAALVAGSTVTAAHAQSAVTFTGTTIGAPTFNRPLTTTSLSGVGTAVGYSARQFTVSLTGSYTFLSTSTTTAYDNFTALYATSFSAAAPLTNILIVNDDNGSTSLSGFTTNLTSGTQYFFVTTGFDNLDVGTFTNTITGPVGSNITLAGGAAAPEPGALALVAAGLPVAVGAIRARRRKTA